MTQIHVIKTANHLLQHCVTISWWNCFANDLLKLQALKIRILYSFYHRAQLCLSPKNKFNNKSGLVTIPSLCSPPSPCMSWMEKGKKKLDSHQWTWTRSSLGITMREQWCIGNHSTTLGSLENTAESRNTICHLSKQKLKANNPKLRSVFLPIKLWLREKRLNSLPDRDEQKWDSSFLGSKQ